VQDSDKSKLHDHYEKEQRILVAMRKTLSSVVKEVTPSHASLKSPLSKATTEDIIMCFGLITAREQELALLTKTQHTQKPHFIDEVKQTQTVSLSSLKSSLKKAKTNNPDI